MTIKDLQLKQQELDNYIIEKNNIQVSDEEMLKNMILACHDEISEVEESPEDVEEYIDVLFFTLSIANRVNIDLDNESFDNECRLTNMREYLLEFTRRSRVFKHWSKKKPNNLDKKAMEDYLNYIVDMVWYNCKRLNCNMFDEYEKKYAENIRRQETGTY